MKVYISHSTGFDYYKELYEPIRSNPGLEAHEIILPHEHSSDQNDVVETFKEIDLIIAEVSFPSTGQGLELGYAATIHIPIVCMHKESTTPSGALYTVASQFYTYKGDVSMLIGKLINEFPRHPTQSPI